MTSLVFAAPQRPVSHAKLAPQPDHGMHGLPADVTVTGSVQPQSQPAGSLAATCAFATALAARSVKKGRRTAPKKAARSAAVDFEDVCEQTGVTINRYVLEMAKRKYIDSDIQSIVNAMSEASKTISKLVNNAPLAQAQLLGLEGEVNVQGEDQKKLDVITNDIFKKALRYTGRLGTIASEEEDVPVSGLYESEVSTVLSDAVADTGKYVCVFDPLDGSSNVDAGIPVGTIFGVFKENDNECDLSDIGNLDDYTELKAEDARCLTDTLQPGDSLVAAGYVLYSASTELVLSIGHGVVGFTLDKTIGEFVLTRPSIVIPPRGKIYSVNEANIADWDEPMRNYITDIQTGKGEAGKTYSLRYIGSMVGDIHRTLLYGGIFAYPADKKNKDGKLRLLYEAAPMSFLMEQAGGKSITGHSRVLDIPPVQVHQRVPIILGSPEDVNECQKYYEESSDPVLKQRCENRLKGVAA